MLFVLAAASFISGLSPSVKSNGFFDEKFNTGIAENLIAVSDVRVVV